jgi:hypothetical protein
MNSLILNQLKIQYGEDSDENTYVPPTPIPQAQIMVFSGNISINQNTFSILNFQYGEDSGSPTPNSIPITNKLTRITSFSPFIFGLILEQLKYQIGADGNIYQDDNESTLIWQDNNDSTTIIQDEI